MIEKAKILAPVIAIAAVLVAYSPARAFSQETVPLIQSSDDGLIVQLSAAVQKKNTGGGKKVGAGSKKVGSGKNVGGKKVGAGGKKVAGKKVAGKKVGPGTGKKVGTGPGTGKKHDKKMGTAPGTGKKIGTGPGTGKKIGTGPSTGKKIGTGPGTGTGTGKKKIGTGPGTGKKTGTGPDKPKKVAKDKMGPPTTSNSPDPKKPDTKKKPDPPEPNPPPTVVVIPGGGLPTPPVLIPSEIPPASVFSPGPMQLPPPPPAAECAQARASLNAWNDMLRDANTRLASIQNDVNTYKQTRDDRLSAAKTDEERQQIMQGWQRDLAGFAKDSADVKTEMNIINGRIAEFSAKQVEVCN